MVKLASSMQKTLSFKRNQKQMAKPVYSMLMVITLISHLASWTTAGLIRSRYHAMQHMGLTCTKDLMSLSLALSRQDMQKNERRICKKLERLSARRTS